MDDLRSKNFAVGIKECRKIVKQVQAEKAYIALYASPHVTDPVRELCEAEGVLIIDAESMEALGKACGIDVGAAVAVIKK